MIMDIWFNLIYNNSIPKSDEISGEAKGGPGWAPFASMESCDLFFWSSPSLAAETHL